MNEQVDKTNDVVRQHNNRLLDMEKRVQFVQELNRTFKGIQNNFTDQVSRVVTENSLNRDKLQKLITEMTNSNEKMCLDTNLVANKLVLRSDKL